jgi:hypothetical protein
MNGGMFQVAVGSNGLKHLSIDAPPSAAELGDEQRGNRAQAEIGGVEIGALQRHLDLALQETLAILVDRDLAFVVGASRFDYPHQAIRNGPIDLR